MATYAISFYVLENIISLFEATFASDPNIYLFIYFSFFDFFKGKQMGKWGKRSSLGMASTPLTYLGDCDSLLLPLHQVFYWIIFSPQNASLLLAFVYPVDHRWFIGILLQF